MQLKVPYRTQYDPDNGCGAAALEMVLNYWQPNEVFSQIAFLRDNGVPVPGGPEGQREIRTDVMIEEARRRGLAAGWGRVSPDPEVLARQLAFFLQAGIPPIAVQRFPPEPALGHFRVIRAFDGAAVKLHDPHKQLGGKNVVWPLAELRDAWRCSGPSVTGGVLLWIAKAAPEVVPLGPGKPNVWFDRRLDFEAGNWR